MVREEGNRTSSLEEVPKPPLFLEFPGSGMANIDNDHMPLRVRYISHFTVGYISLFQQDIVPSCASARENDPGRGIAGHEFFVCVP
jgi:hypothetical protein